MMKKICLWTVDSIMIHELVSSLFCFCFLNLSVTLTLLVNKLLSFLV